MGFHIVSGYLAALLLLSAAAVVITFKLSKQPNMVKSEVVKAERRLLYHTIFVSFWMILAQIGETLRIYILVIDQEPEWVDLALINFIDICYLISNSGSLIFLFYLSSAVKKEFYETFKLFNKFKSKKKVAFTPVTTVC